MFGKVKNLLLSIFLSIFYLGILLGWGFFSHEKINYYFISSIGKNIDAKNLFEFYKMHLDYIVKHAGDPDKRRFCSTNEKGRHFFNIECFGDEIMKQEFVSYSEFVNYYAYNFVRKLYPELKGKELIDKHITKVLREYGTNPWSIMFSKDALTEAFKKKDINTILFETINLAHYIADSCVVFHCTENYDGQLTGQHGIHAFWESTIPQYFFDEFGVEDNIQPAQYDKDFKKTIWKNILHSNAESKRALRIEKQLDNDVKIGKFCYKAHGKNVARMHSKQYSKEYNSRLSGQIANQIIIAIKLVADAVYTAWVDAGKPNLLDVLSDGSYQAQCANAVEKGNENENVDGNKRRNINRWNANENVDGNKRRNINRGNVNRKRVGGRMFNSDKKRGARRNKNNNIIDGDFSWNGNKKKYAGVLAVLTFVVFSFIYKMRRVGKTKKRSKGR